MRAKRKIPILIVIFLVLILTGCGKTYMRNPLSKAYGDTAQVPYIPNARFWGDVLPAGLQEDIDEIKVQIEERDTDAKRKTVGYLVISGGGAC